MVSTRSSVKENEKEKVPKKSKKDKKPKEPKEPKNYMQKYRKDPDKVYREDRLKRIRAIRSGIIPRPSTLQKYNITPAEVNQERQEAGLKKLQEEEIEPYPIESARTLAMEINRKTKADLIKKAEQDYLKLKENRKELTKTQEETKEKCKGQIVDVPKENLFEISQLMNHFVKYSRRKPNGELLSEARLLHYGIKMVYSDTNLDKNTTVKSASFNGKGQIVGLLNDIDKKYLKDLSLLFEPGAVEKFISDLKGLKKFKANTQQQKIELLNTLLKEYPGFNVTDSMSDRRDVVVKKIDDAIVHQFTPMTQALKINDQKTKTYTPWLEIKAKVAESYPRGTPEHLYMELFEEVPSRDDIGSIRVYDHAGHLKESDFSIKTEPDKILSTEIKTLIENVKAESTKYGIVDNMIIRYGSSTKHFGFIVCMYNYKTHKLHKDIYTEIKDKNLTVDLNRQIEKVMANQKDDADIPLFKGPRKQSTWISGFLTKAGVKDGSKTNNTGSTNLLRHSYIDYKINIIEKSTVYSLDERIKLATMMKHSVQTSPAYLSVVLAEPLTAKEKKEVAAITTRSKSK